MLIIEDKLISLDLFEKKFACAVDKCKGACCVQGDFGAPLESEEITQIRNILPKIMPRLLPEAQEKLTNGDIAVWYEEMDAYGTLLLDDGMCAFAKINESGIAECTIQAAYQEGAIDINKPLSCHLYPIRIEEKEELNFTAINYDQWDICSPACKNGEAAGIKVYQFAKQALIRKFGEDFYAALEDADRKMEKETS